MESMSLEPDGFVLPNDKQIIITRDGVNIVIEFMFGDSNQMFIFDKPTARKMLASLAKLTV